MNVKGTLSTGRAFFPSRKKDASVIGVSTNAYEFPSSFLDGFSAYVTSKLAQGRLMQMLAAENPDVFIGVMHPGIIETEMMVNSGVSGVPIDSILLPAHFIVWMASKEARFIHGKFVYANWDIDELKAKSEKVQSSDDLTISLRGYEIGS